MRQLVKLIDKSLAASLIAAMAAILLVVVWQVISRYLLKDPASVTEELSRFLLIWIGILGSAYAYRQKVHLGFNLIVNRQSETMRRLIMTFVELLVVTFCVLVLIVGGNALVSLTLDLNQISAALGVKMGWIYTVLPVSGVIMVFYSFINIYNLWIDESQEPL
ncbi:TRAP transporter small permease [Alteromonas sp. RKMC-009]|uniref:TRAP transporter small permease n=1 Tax=Alteromonas sp. RKMC-009 TaxID=2267264 RepID=UPI000E6809A7|nr:TRAP transporter small permease [Alteromonas sp. RKMC-009]AYA62851.1 TRAP transporter small permease [Alteromonas sp. RKMC-009]MEC7689183.1 TRAP transporter small permease [Pseudomonadota bacterium]